MGTYILGDIVNAVETTVSVALSLRRSQSYDELTEGIHEYPLLQVYPSGNTGTAWNSETDRYTFRGPVGPDPAAHHSVKEYLINVDVYARQRSHINEDMKQVVDTVNEIEDILDDQAYPVFGRDDIFSTHGAWNYVMFDYGGVLFAGARFIITVRVGVEH